MRGFFKAFFASFLALVVFAILGVVLLIGLVAGATSSDKPVVGRNAVLVLDISSKFKEQSQGNTFSALLNAAGNETPALYDIVLLLHHARSDSSVKGLYILCGNNPNGYAASEELRMAIQDFKSSGKFVVSYGETISQKGYYIGNMADKIYCHPQGGVDWSGFSVNMLYLKGLLDKLEIQPQIFYAGKFKSATEPLRATKMSDADRLQTSVWLGDLYTHFLLAAGKARHLDTAALRELAVKGSIQTASDALANKLVDGLMYDDQVKKELLDRLRLDEKTKINFVTFSDYSKAVTYKEHGGSGKIAVIYADGDIVSGNGDNEQVGSDAFRNIIRRARMDKEIKAIVFRVNSPGGSSLASDVIWREVTLARKEKPVIVTMGDVAASGGYYIACGADSVFANAGTITGSIGVFSIVPNMQSFFKDKLGVTFDGVKTAPYADMGSSDRPLTEPEKHFFQAATDSIYQTFKSRVAEGRKKDIVYIDTIAQGRVWTGARGLQVGLVDRIGTMQDAMDCAARMAHLKGYTVKEYPEKKSLYNQLMNGYKKTIRKDLLKEEVGEAPARVMQQAKQVNQMIGIPQAKLPFLLTFN